MKEMMSNQNIERFAELVTELTHLTKKLPDSEKHAELLDSLDTVGYALKFGSEPERTINFRSDRNIKKDYKWGVYIPNEINDGRIKVDVLYTPERVVSADKVLELALKHGRRVSIELISESYSLKESGQIIVGSINEYERDGKSYRVHIE